MDHVPEMDEVAEIAGIHLDEYPAEQAHATVDIVYKAPEWLNVHERDQIGAHMRDGAACILIIYMSEGVGDEDEDEFLD